jgi:predicted nuclease of predicted toxin-antitoxin system
VNFFADENVSRLLVRWLRDEGHDVEWIVEIAPGSSDPDVLAAAAQSNRVLITFDLDFGEHVYRHRLHAHGVILIRLAATDESERLAILQRHWPAIAANAVGNFIVVTNRKMRVRPLTRP